MHFLVTAFRKAPVGWSLSFAKMMMSAPHYKMTEVVSFLFLRSLATHMTFGVPMRNTVTKLLSLR